MHYRTTLDGLRAVAVIAVIGYHAGFSVLGESVLPGGFLGVDVFFVISGYLISGLLLAELENTGRIDLRHFYERRARRILPALLLVMAVSLPYAWRYLLPDGLIEYAQSMLATLSFVSNGFFYFTTTAYGAESSQLKPLLHTWSLGVEEQFYLLFPLLLLLFRRRLQHYPLRITLGALLASFCFSLLYSGRDPSLNFYLPFSRGWELLTGTLVAILERKYPTPNNRLAAEALPMIGLGMVCYAILFLSGETHHPGLPTLVPVAGAALILAFARDDGVVGRLLSLKPVAFTGLVSYSLYLWHFPVFAFMRIQHAPPSNAEMARSLSLVFFLAVISFYGVERPFRNRRMVPVRLLAVSLGAAGGLILAASCWLISVDGAVSRLNGAALNFYRHFSQNEWDRLEGENGSSGESLHFGHARTTCDRRDPPHACQFGDGRFVTLGDSFVGHYEYALLERLRQRQQGLLSFSYAQCPFVATDLWFGDHAECPLVNERRWAIIKGFREQKIFIISANEGLFLDAKRRTRNPLQDGRNEIRAGEPVAAQQAWDSYFANIRQLLALGHKVILIRSLPPPDDIDARQAFFSALREAGAVTVPVRYSSVNPQAVLARDNAVYPDFHSNNLLVIDPVNALCSQQGRLGQCMVIAPEGALYNGGGHLSYFGANRILDDLFRKMAEKHW